MSQSLRSIGACFVVATVIVISTLLLYATWVGTLPLNLPRLKFTKRNTTEPDKLILLWTKPWDADGESPPEGRKFGPCILTYKQTALSRASAVVFHYWKVPVKWPHYRDQKQRFVWWSKESPWVVQWFENQPLTQFDNFFNWTMTYKRDADAYMPYQSMYRMWKELTRGKKVVDQIVSKKKALVAWVVSECSDKKGARMRLDYVNEMMTSLPEVDRYGRCFGNRDDMPWSKMPGFVGEHKFYLSFENSLHCADYITEKFFNNAIRYGAVPVVWGTRKSDYLAVAPPHSFIHAEDFESPRHLSEHLLYLDSNATAYREYFAWREEPDLSVTEMRRRVALANPTVDVDQHERFGFDDLCHRLWNDDASKVIPSLRKEVIGSEPEECTSKT